MLVPDTLLQNRYLVVRLIKEGGMGAVYLARDQRFGNNVALKEAFFSDEKMRRAFKREARLLAHLRHPALPKVIDNFDENGGQFLVMEFIPGDDLETQLVDNERPFPVDQVLVWAEELLKVLEHLHQQVPPILHRDIKPSNVKLTPQGEIILLDFGLAKGSVGILSSDKTSGSVLGFTPNFAPLEQIQGTGTNPRSDLYSLAATLYYLMTGAVPPDALTRITEVANGHADPLCPADELNSQIPCAVAEVLRTAMSQNRDQRPADASEMRRALREANTPPQLYRYQPGKTAPSPPGQVNPPPLPLPPDTTLPLPDSQNSTWPINPILQPFPGPMPVERKALGLRLIIWGCLAVSLLGVLVAIIVRYNAPSLNQNSNNSVISDTNRQLVGAAPTPAQWNLRQPELRVGTEVYQVAFSPDGRTIASALGDGNVGLWDVQSARPLAPLPARHRMGTHTIAFSPDGRFLVSGGQDNKVDNRGNHLMLWEVQTGRLVQSVVAHNRDVAAVAFSPPDGRKLAVVGSFFQAVTLLDVLWQDGVMQLDSEFKHGNAKKSEGRHEGAVKAVAFSPDGRMLATASSDPKTGIILWDPATGKMIGKAISGHRNQVMTIAFSPDGKLLASGSKDNTVKLWDVNQNGAFLRKLGEHDESVLALAFSPDGGTLASVGADRRIKIWDVASGELRQTIEAHGNIASTVTFSSDGKLLASGSFDGTVKLWEPIIPK